MREKVDNGKANMTDALEELEEEYNNGTSAHEDPCGATLVSKILEIDSLEDGRTLLMYAAFKGKVQQFREISLSIRARVSSAVLVSI